MKSDVCFPEYPMKWIAFVALLMLYYGLPLAADETRKVYVSNPDLESTTGTIQMLDLTATDLEGDEKANAILDAVYGGAYDLVIFETPVPANACDNLNDCKKAIDEACAAIGSTRDTVIHSLERRRCDGVCANGRGVNVACSTPQPKPK